jgi:hypothetical protein
MKIKPLGSNFADRTFQIELSGRELAHIYRLSTALEGGSRWPGQGEGRLHELIEEALDQESEWDLRNSLDYA